jgi:hypothetical protein
MKPLLTTLLLLFCLTGRGQYYIDLESGISIPYNLMEYITMYSSLNRHFSNDTIPIIEKKKAEFAEVAVTLWDEYSQECYADSVSYYGDGWVDAKTHKLMSRDIYIHPNKPYFEGFIEFICKKYGI